MAKQILNRRFGKLKALSPPAVSLPNCRRAEHAESAENLKRKGIRLGENSAFSAPSAVNLSRSQVQRCEKKGKNEA